MSLRFSAPNAPAPSLVYHLKSVQTNPKYLEERKIKALEKLASAVDSLTLWFEEIDKSEWDERAQWYLAEFLKASQDKNEDSE